LEAEERARKEAEQREKLLEAKSKRASNPETQNHYESERIKSDAGYKKLPEEKIVVKGDGYHKESFFGNHVKLITFIICAALIITVVGPWGLDRMVDKGREEVFGKEIENKTELSAAGVLLLADMGDSLTWEAFSNLSGVDYSYEKDGVKTHIYEYPVKGTGLYLRVGGSEVGTVHEFVITGTNIVLFRRANVKLPESPEYVRLIDYESGAYVNDIRKDDVRAFLASYE
jgi:hypothetical protein